jgi:PhnB protein
MAVKPIPDGYYTATPYLIVKGAARALDFYKQAFGAQELMRFPMPDGKVGHAEIKIGNSPICWRTSSGDGAQSPGSGRITGQHPVYVPDVDKTFAQALKAGGKEPQPLKDQFYGVVQHPHRPFVTSDRLDA